MHLAVYDYTHDSLDVHDAVEYVGRVPSLVREAVRRVVHERLFTEGGVFTAVGVNDGDIVQVLCLLRRG